MKNFEDTGIKKLISLIKAKFDSLAKVATSGSYNDLSDKPTIPSVGNGKITIKQGETTKGTFTVNQSGATTIELTDTDTVTTVTTTGSGNAVTSITDDNGKLTVTKGSTFLTAHPTISTTTDTTSTASPAHGETFTAVDSVVRDGNGHVTKVNTKTITLPTDNDTHYTSKNVVGSSADDTNNTTTALTNGNVFLNSVENGSVTSSHNIKGIGGTTVSTDTSGNIIIKGTTGTYSTGTDKTAGITKLYSGLGSNTDGTMTQLAIGDALNGKAGAAHTHTKSQITDFPTSLKNPNGLRVQVNGDGASEIRYDGSAAKTINIKAGSNITITSDSSGNITISSTASAGSVTGDVGTVVYEASSGGLYCDGSTANTTANSKAIQDSSFKYKRFRFYCQGYYGLVCVDMPLDRECYAYATGDDRGKRYGGVIFPTAENGNIDSTGIGPSNHMYYELKWRVTKETAGWRVRVVDSGWLGFNAGITSNANYTGNSSAAVAGTNYISWNQRHNNGYCIYKIVAYTD